MSKEIKICIDCRKEYLPTGPNQKRCVACGKEKVRLDGRLYDAARGPRCVDPKKQAVYNKRWRDKHDRVDILEAAILYLKERS